MRFLESPATLLEIAIGAGSNQIGPAVFPASVTGHNMINCKVIGSSAAVLASIVISTKDFTFCETHMWSGAFNHIPQPDDRGAWIRLPHRMNKAASVEQQLSFASEQKAHGSLG